MLDHVGCTAAAAAITGCLVILASLTHAAFAAGKALDAHLLQQFAAWVASEHVRGLENAAMQRQIVMVVANVVDLGGDGVHSVAEAALPRAAAPAG